MYNHHLFTATFQGGTIQIVRYIFGDPLLNVKLVAERPAGVVFVGRVFKIPSKCKLACSRPSLKNTLKNVAYILGTSPP